MNIILQKKNIILAVLGVAAAIIVCCFAFAAGSDYTVVLNKIASDDTTKVKFETDPIMIDNNLLVPLRDFCDSAGFSVDWDTDSQSACITLEADISSTPIKRFCDKTLTVSNSNKSITSYKSIQVFIPIDSCTVKILYNYADSNGNDISNEKKYQSPIGAKIVKDGMILVPLRTLAEAFSLEADWDAAAATATVSIPDADTLTANVPAMHIMSNENLSIPTQTPVSIIDSITDIPQPPSIMYSPIENYKIGDYIGTFKITHYCSCPICNEGYGNSTAYGGAVRPGITIAVDPSVIKRLAWVYIDGYGARLAEDVGGAIKGNRIDMAVSDHSTAMRMGVTYKDVWYAAVPDGSEKINASAATGNTSEHPTVSPEPTEDTAASESPESEISVQTPTPEKTQTPEKTNSADTAD